MYIAHNRQIYGDDVRSVYKTIFLKDNPDIEQFDITDSSLIVETQKAGYATPAVARRMYNYFMGAVEAGADAILVTCTSVNTVTKKIRDMIPVPVISVEEPGSKESCRSCYKENWYFIFCSNKCRSL